MVKNWNSGVFTSLLFVCFSQITFGGQVTDARDQLCLTGIIGMFFSPAILEDDCKFSRSGENINCINFSLDQALSLKIEAHKLF